jgi:8-oxo-dGTP pyrophosphatase MutT (NUDIX family)
MKPVREKVLVWIYCKAAERDLFLILKTNRQRGEFWQPVTGSVEEGESIEQAALREMCEETGLKPLSEIRQVSPAYEFQGNRSSNRETPFMAEVAGEDFLPPSKISLDPHEHTEFQWVDAEDALKLLKHESNAAILKNIVQYLRRK